MPVLNKFYFKLYQFLSHRFPAGFCYCRSKKSVVKFVISGSLASAVDLFFLFIFYGVFELGIVLSTSVSFLLSFLVSFYLQKLWTFRNEDEKKMPRQLVLYLLNSFLSLNLNGFGMHLLVTQLGIWYLLSQVIVNLILGSLNFFIYKFIIFRHDDETNCEQEPLE